MIQSQTETKSPYRPNAKQIARVAAMRRFNWLYVYTPLLTGSLIFLALIGIMFWGVFSPQVEGTQLFLSAMADVVIILISLPLIMLGLLAPIALGGIIFYNYNKRKERKESLDPDPVVAGKLQRLIWQLDSFLDNVYAKISDVLPKIANPIIQLNSLLAYLETIIKRIKKIITRS